MTIKVDGLRQTIRAFERLGVEVADLKRAFTRIGENVVQEARSIAPKQSGRLANSIRASRTKNKSIVRAGAGLQYAGVIHYGYPARNIEPQPFLTDAVARKQAESVRLLEIELADLIRKVDLK